MADGASSGWIWVIQWVAMGPIFVVAMNRVRTLDRALAIALLTTLGLQIFLLLIRSVSGGISPWTLVERSIEASIQRAFVVYGEMGLVPEEMTISEGSISNLSRAIALIVPGSIIAVDTLLYWWTLLVQRWVMGLSGIQGPGPKVLRTWGLPYPWVWVTIMGGVLTVLPVGGLGWIGVNLLIVMGTLHFLQGIGVLSTFFHNRDVPAFIRGIFYFLVCFQQVVLLGVIILGMFDIWFDFRKRWAPKSTDR